MKISFVDDQVAKNKFRKTVDAGKAFYANKVKPAIKDGVKYTKNLAKDSVEFVKKNPKKIGKFAALGLLAGSVIALGVKAVKDFVATKKQNAILKDAVLAQRDTINVMKEVNAISKDIIAAKDRTIEELKK